MEERQDEVNRRGPAGPDLHSLCKLGGIAAFLLLAYSIATMVQMMLLGGPPASAFEAFALLQKSKILGLLRLDFPTVIAMPLYFLLSLGLFVSLRPAHPAYAALFIGLAFAGLTLVLATPGALSMLSLSDKYAAAPTPDLKQQFLAAGEAVLAADMWHGTGAWVGGALFEIACILISFTMLRSRDFSRMTAYVGVVLHGFDLAHIAAGPFLPAAGIALMAIAGPLYPIWFFLVGRTLLKLGTLPDS